ncbi:hypothetical protein [Altibacter sp. HG106]|uniref:hypothetical protein n=1 Tax=Altibacter sp. HG106 TaxID=3023937 RepID=UPI002350C5BF|nr:hypothetical protein [Altibacter sp. HG106]MDC7995519.1 hypothetical protein [Altibacter sp. HG106]
MKFLFLINLKKLLTIKVPKTRGTSLRKGILFYGLLTIIGLLLGAAIATYIFFGIIILAGMIALIESNRYLKYLAVKSNKLIDILLFALSLYATISLGITITASITFAGLGYTLVYAPILRRNKSE